MLQSIQHFYSSSRENLKGKWTGMAGITLGFLLLYQSLQVILNLIFVGSLVYFSDLQIATGTYTFSSFFVLLICTCIFAIAISFMLAPMPWSYQILFLRNKRGERYEFSSIFSGYKDFFRVAGTSLLISGYIVFWNCFFVLPFVAFSTIFCMSFPLLGIIAKPILFFVGSVVANIITIAKGISYCLTPYILYDYPNLKYDAAIELSKAMMKGHKWQMFRLTLTFVGYSMISLITLNIAFLWLAPYMCATMANFYEVLKENYIQKQA